MKVNAILRKTSCMVYIRLIDGRKVDFKAPTEIRIDQTLFDSAIPGYIDSPKIILCFLLSTILHWCTTNIALEVFVEEGVIGKMQSVGDFQYRHGGKSKH